MHKENENKKQFFDGKWLVIFILTIVIFILLAFIFSMYNNGRQNVQFFYLIIYFGQ